MTKQAAYRQTEEQVLSSVQSTKERFNFCSSKRTFRKMTVRMLYKQEKRQQYCKNSLISFKDFMIIVLLAAAVISFFAQKELQIPTDAIVILAVVILNAIVGVIQESKAEEAIEALQKMASPVATVLRDGEHLHVKGEENCSWRYRDFRSRRCRSCRYAIIRSQYD